MQAHTTGINCELCEDGWYRPTGVSLLDPAPCRPCNCNKKPGAIGRCAQDGDPTGKVQKAVYASSSSVEVTV